MSGFSKQALDRVHDFITAGDLRAEFDGMATNRPDIDTPQIVAQIMSETFINADGQVTLPETREAFDEAVNNMIRSSFKEKAGGLGMMYYGIATGGIRNAADDIWTIATEQPSSLDV